MEKDRSIAPPAKIKRWSGGGFSFRFTKAGYIYLAITLFAYFAMRSSGTNLLYFVFGLMVGMLVVSLLFSALSLRAISIKRIFGEHIVAGEPSDIEYVLTNRKRFWPCIGLRIQEWHADLASAPAGFILYLPRKGTLAFDTQLVARRRGRLHLSAIRLSTSFPFGFVERIVTLQLPQDLIVYPRIGLLNRHLALQYRESIETGTMTSNLRGGTDEFYGLREYRPGDNIRAIHWRSTARTRTLMIREMAANAPPQMIVVLNLRSASHLPDAEERVESAIELAATLICYGFFENFAVGLAIAGLDTVVPPSPLMGRDSRAELLKRLAVLDPDDIRQNEGIAYPNRLAGRAEWIIVTLDTTDECRDLLGPIASSSLTAASSTGALRTGHHTILAMNSPDAPNWVKFLTPQDTLRLLRNRTEAET